MMATLLLLVCATGMTFASVPDMQGELGSTTGIESLSLYTSDSATCSDESACSSTDLVKCGRTDIALNSSATMYTVRAPPLTQQTKCVGILPCAWLISSDPGTSIYIEVTKQNGLFIYSDENRMNLVQIGEGLDPSNATSVFAYLELFYARHLADGRVYIINGNTAWVSLTAHGEDSTECVGFELTFTQRVEPDFCASGTRLCPKSSICLPPSAFCDANWDCGQFTDQVDCETCGNSSIELVTLGEPHVIEYGLEWARRSGSWNLPHQDCFWVISAPDDTVIEVSILAINNVGPTVYWGTSESDDLLPFHNKGYVLTRYFLVGIRIYADFLQKKTGETKLPLFTLQLTANKKRYCGPGEFLCFDQHCIAGTRQCDGMPDCREHEDEFGCDRECASMYYRCPSNVMCLHPFLVCDGYAHCPDAFDEFNCGRCGESYINLIPEEPFRLVQPLDISVDCLWVVNAPGNNSRIRVDVLSLPIIENIGSIPYLKANLSFGYGDLPYTGMQVVRMLSHARAYPKMLTFDGPRIWILLDIVSNLIRTPNRLLIELAITEYNEKDCGVGKFACSAGLLCIDENKVCDGNVDCPEFDDEYGCDACNESQYKCSLSGECIRNTRICSGDFECADRTDEQNCNPCGITNIELSSQPSFVASLQYPDNYPANLHCIWFIRAEPGYDIMIVFLDFITEEYYDFVFVGNMTDGRVLAKISGPRAFKRISTYSSLMWMSFLSDFMQSKRGFNVSFEQVAVASCDEGEVACNGTTLLICVLEERVCDGTGDCPASTDEEYCEDICGETLVNLLGKWEYTLTSPLYLRGIYPDVASCTWFFYTDPAREKIRLFIRHFDVEKKYDYLRIGVGNDTTQRLVAHLTGKTKISEIWFENGQVWLNFQTDDTINGLGFDIALITVDKEKPAPCRARCSHYTDTVLCLLPHANCDGVADCSDNSDETGCLRLNCSSHLFMCLGKKQCVSSESVCDGVIDCELYGDDEQNCDVHGCPEDCSCSINDGDLHVQCRQGWNVNTVNQLVKITHTLELTGGSGEELGDGLFKKLRWLRTLYLRNNNISVISLQTFAGLTNLTSLDISENDIQELPRGTFSKMPRLKNLGMRSTPMRYVRSGAFDGLTQLQSLVLMRSDGKGAVPVAYEMAIVIEDNALDDLRSLQTLYVDDHRLCCDFKSVLENEDHCINIELQSPLFNCGRLMPNKVLQIFMWILGCSALIGNVVVIVWRLREDSGKGSKYVHTFLVLNLAMSDFLMGVYMLIIAGTDAARKEKYYLEATQWRNSALCKAAGVISVLSSEASVFFITLISVDRYLCIVHPFSRVRLQEASVWVSAAAIWIASLIISLVPTVVVTSNSDVYGLSDVCIGLPLLTRPTDFTFKEADTVDALGNATYLIPHPVGSKPTWSYSIALFLGVNFVSFVTVTVCYISIYAKVRKSVQRTRRHSHKEEEIKMASKMAIIVGSDFLCWMPIIVLGILSQTNAIRIQSDAYAWLVVFVLPINSSLNPYLYTVVTVLSRKRSALLASKTISKNPKVFSSPEIHAENKTFQSYTLSTPSTASPSVSMSLDLIK